MNFFAYITDFRNKKFDRNRGQHYVDSFLCNITGVSDTFVTGHIVGTSHTVRAEKDELASRLMTEEEARGLQVQKKIWE